MVSRIIRKLKITLKDPFFRLLLTSVPYTLWVIWFGNLWLLFGIIVLADIHLTKFINWRFWRKRLRKGQRHKWTTELFDSAIIAVFVVLAIRSFFFEAYTIPTSSMEKTLCVGDYIMVSKFRYGPRMPMTPLTIPFTHNTLPFTTNSNSFIRSVQLPYQRLSGHHKIKNYDVVTFNYPEGDTVIKNLPEKSYYSMVRQYGREYIKNNYALIMRPVDKRDNYTKRVIGIPGDTVQILHGKAYINGEAEKKISGLQHNYSAKSEGGTRDTAVFNKLNIALYDVSYNEYNDIYAFPLTRNMYYTILDSNAFKAIVKYENIDPSASNKLIFPFDERFSWTEDNFGPIVVPKKGMNIDLTADNLPLYNRIISAYERNSVTTQGDSIFINNELVTDYTFKMDYFFMLGDNRHNSNDSRYWGFVPEDHIIGKASLVWLSLDRNKQFPKNIRWNKMFKFIG